MAVDSPCTCRSRCCASYDNDVGNDTNNSTLDVGKVANSPTPDDGNNAVKPVLDKYNLNDEFDAEGYTFII